MFAEGGLSKSGASKPDYGNPLGQAVVQTVYRAPKPLCAASNQQTNNHVTLLNHQNPATRRHNLIVHQALLHSVGREGCILRAHRSYEPILRYRPVLKFSRVVANGDRPGDKHRDLKPGIVQPNGDTRNAP